MGYTIKNKVLMGLLVLLLLANIATITIFWLGKPKYLPLPKGQPAEFLIQELGFDAVQKETFLGLVKQHQLQAATWRLQVKTAKDNFFKLLQRPSVTDSEQVQAAKNISVATEQLDMATFNHFKKVRMICNSAQQKKFDNIFQDVLHTMGGRGAKLDMRQQGRPLGEKQELPPPGSSERLLAPPEQ